MELRPPPRPVDHPSQDRWLRPLLVAQLAGLVVLALLVWMRASGPSGAGRDPEQLREVATKLLAAGALDQAAEGFERYLAVAEEPSEVRAKIAYSVGSTYLEQGAYEKALRWFYEAESLGAGYPRRLNTPSNVRPILDHPLGCRLVLCGRADWVGYFLSGPSGSGIQWVGALI